MAIVICINSDNNELEFCTLDFEKNLYTKLLEGASVRESFDSAIKSACCGTMSESCCCAHDHDKNCVWYE